MSKLDTEKPIKTDQLFDKFSHVIEQVNIEHAINRFSEQLKKLESSDPQSQRIQFIQSDILKLSQLLDEMKVNT